MTVMPIRLPAREGTSCALAATAPARQKARPAASAPMLIREAPDVTSAPSPHGPFDQTARFYRLEPRRRGPARRRACRRVPPAWLGPPFALLDRRRPDEPSAGSRRPVPDDRDPLGRLPRRGARRPAGRAPPLRGRPRPLAHRPQRPGQPRPPRPRPPPGRAPLLPRAGPRRGRRGPRGGALRRGRLGRGAG